MSTTTSTTTLNPCLEELLHFGTTPPLNYFTPEQITSILDMGIVERGVLNSEPFLCQFVDKILDVNPTLTSTQVYDYLVTLLNNGLILDFRNINNCNTIVNPTDCF